MDNGRDNLDRLIDYALVSYSSAEPLEGLERRVWNRVRGAQMRRRVFAWTAALAVAASVAVVGIAIRVDRREVAPKRVEGAQARHAFPTAEASLPRIIPKEAARTAPKRRKRPEILPKLEQFPSPSPMTVQERALVALARQDPGELEKFAEMERQSDAPIEIQPIQIAPLHEDGDQ